MSEILTIGPITRIEGHGKVTVHLDDDGQVTEAHLHMTEFRGFEKFCEGRMLWEMPIITSRICGVCPVSHHIASAKACDAVLRLRPPPAGSMLRELMLLGEIIHSHATHFFYMAGPDLLLGPDWPVEERNVLTLAALAPNLAEKAIRLRAIGLKIVAAVGGRAFHPPAAVPGGLSKPLSHEERHRLLQHVEEALPIAQSSVAIARVIEEDNIRPLDQLGPARSSYLSLTRYGALSLYDGMVRLIDDEGTQLADFAAADYLEHLAERALPSSYGKAVYHRAQGFPEGSYRVNSLARLNVCDHIATPLAQEQLDWFKGLADGPVHRTRYYHQARLIELLYCVERAQQLLADDDITSTKVRVPAHRRSGEGVGVVEAPRGTLLHHYVVDRWGRVEKANLIVATAHNTVALNRAVTDAAKAFIRDGKPAEGMLNRVEMALRAYDPCLACATHAVGSMPLVIDIVQPDGSTTSLRQGRRSTAPS